MRFTIDGDEFLSVFLDNRDWESLVEQIYPLYQSGKFFTPKFTILKPDDPDATEAALGYVANNKGRTRPFKVTNSGFQFGWRPVLDPIIPFDENDMPDNTIMTGGSLYLAMPGQDEFQCVDRTGPGDPYPYRHGLRFRIGDTGTPEQTLKWIVANGKLICQSVLVVNVSYAKLKTLV